MDPSELQKSLALSKLLSKQVAGMIHELLVNMVELKSHLENLHPHLGALHQKMTQGEPVLFTPVELPVETDAESVAIEKEESKE